MKGTRKFTSEEAVRMMRQGRGDEMFIPLSQLPEQLGLSQVEIMGELRSGRMLADGRPTAEGFDDVHVTIEHLVDWLETGSPAALKTRKHWRRKELN